MRFRFVTQKSLRRVLTDGLLPATAPFENFVSGAAGTTDASDAARADAGRPGLLEAFRHYRDMPEDAYDMIGFDVPTAPFLIDPFPSRSVDMVPEWLDTLRRSVSNVWRSPSIVTDRDGFAAYQNARATMDDASRARLSMWLRSVDIVVTPLSHSNGGPAKRAGISEILPIVRRHARELDVFSARTTEEPRPLEAWPAYCNFIMPAGSFRDFADGLFTLLSSLERTDPDLTRHHGLPITEFAIGLFLRDLTRRHPLLRVRQVPVLQIRRTHPTADVLEQFDAAFYSASYPDVLAAGQAPLRHFIEHGYREYRGWTSCD